MGDFNKKEYNKIYRQKNLEAITKREKEYKFKNRELINKKASDYAKRVREEKGDVYKRMLERKRLNSAKYREKNTSIIKEKYEKNKEEYNRKRRLKYSLNENKKKVILTDEQRLRKNKANSEYSKRIRISGRLTQFDKLKKSVRRRTCYAFNRIRINKPYNTEKLIGINMVDLKIYLESLFKDGMSWENRNLWHIDHIIPLASAKTEDEMIKLCHYTNLQPLWAFENMSKGAKILTNIKNN